ncbi:MAG: hypothetical protein IKH29_01935 [Methanobrevibacter sp.]|uniref:hypothetical protein n=2 Tax=Methanobrevibacter sp. TaxID=66852 RepID=UPI0025E548F7|nr:hypothetical protein [Methanobrevibacter sp.]MBR3112456.1 hypothetical protein [Methanobrevibacter sp.]MBR6992926.1 hypothetical protein [Methanobrevibacter sp.]
MATENKIQEYQNILEEEKLMIETHFVNIERILREPEVIEQEKLVALMNNFNTLNIQYDQLCNDLIEFIKVFKDKDEQEIRLYKTDELVELLQAKIDQLEKTQ